MINNIDMYCVTNKKLIYLEKLPYHLAGVGTESFDEKYIIPNSLVNIMHKEKNYSELSFHYWIWKNKLSFCQKKWIGFCQKRRFWLRSGSKVDKINLNNLGDNVLKNINEENSHYDSFICESIKVSNVKKIKLIKRGWKNLIKHPSIFIDKNKQTINLHFDMHHGYKNLEKAINLLEERDQNEFHKYVNVRNYFNPHIMFITKPKIAKKWFDDLFPWLERCEDIFGFEGLKGYDTTRIYAYLAERYLSFWFKRYTNYKELPWIFLNDK